MDYKCKRWQRLRRTALSRDRQLCQECRRYGRQTQATTAHHAYPAEECPELAWELWNLVSLCGEHHNAMHDRDTRQLTALGRQWQQRVHPPSPPGGL